MTASEPLFYASGPFKSWYVLDKDTISNIVLVVQPGHMGSLCTGDTGSLRGGGRKEECKRVEREREREIHMGSLCTGDIVNFQEKERGGGRDWREKERVVVREQLS